MQGDFLINTKDYGRVHNPYGSALLVSEHSDGYFELVIPLESITSVFGDYETFDYNILTEKAKGLTKGKLEMTTATQEFLLTKENLFRLDELKGKVYEYMVVGGNGVGYTFNAEIDYKIGDIDNGDNLKGEMTITPSSFGGVIRDCRPHIRQTLTFAGTIPSSIVLTSKDKSYKLNCDIEEIKNVSTDNFEFAVMDATEDYKTVWSDGQLTITASESIKAPAYGTLYITATSNEKMGQSGDEAKKDKYAPYTIIVDLSYEEVVE